MVNIYDYNANVVIGFYHLWGLITGIDFNEKYRDTDFTFVTNRMSSTLSNILLDCDKFDKQ